MKNHLRSICAAPILLFVLIPAHGSLVKYRVTNRNSVFCASLLNATRLLSGPDSITGARSALRSFREEVLNARPVGDLGAEKAIVANSDQSAKMRDVLVRRVYSAERSFDRPVMNDDHVIAVAILDATNFDRLIALTGTARDQYFQQAVTFERNGTFGREGLFDSRTLGFTHNLWGSWFAFKGASLSTVFSFFSVFIGITDPLDPHSALSFGTVCFLSAVGAYDYPVHHIRSHQNGFRNLSKALARFNTSKEGWLYWSRDVWVSPEFVTELLSTPTAKWATVLRPEDFREQTSGYLRFKRDRERRRTNTQNIHFSIDILARKQFGAPTLTIVLRSQPAMPPVRQTEPEAVPNGVLTGSGS